MSNNTVNFKVAGNEVFSFMDKVKQKSDQLTNDMISNAQKQGVSAKDQLKLIEDQIKALQRKNQIEAEGGRQTARDSKNGQYSTIEEERQKSLSRLSSDPKHKDFTDRLRSTINEKADAKITDVDKQYRDQLTALREQERQSILQTKLLKDNVESVKMTSTQEIAQMKTGTMLTVDELDKDAKPMDKLARELAVEKASKGDTNSDEDKDAKPGLFQKLVGVQQVEGLLKTMQTFTSTQNGFDLIKPAATGAGQIAGAILGGVLGGLLGGPGGAMAGAEGGSIIGSAIGGMGGELEQKRLMAVQNYLGARNRLGATTGDDNFANNTPDTTSMGVAPTEYLNLLRQVSITMGTTQKAMENTNSVIALEKGVGVSKETTGSLLTLFRGTQKDVSGLVSAVMDKGANGVFQGKDYTFLNEFMQRFADLQKTLMSSSADVHTGTVYSTLDYFNNLGGPFGLRDFRSQGLISNIQGSLSSPQGDSSKALALLSLRRLNPTAGVADLQEMMEGGLNTPGYLQAMVRGIHSMGGGEQFERMRLQGTLGISAYASHYIYSHMNDVLNGKISGADIDQLSKTTDFQTLAEQRTTDLEKSTAGIDMSLLLPSWTDATSKMKDAFFNAVNNAFNGASIQMDGATLKFSPGTVKQNGTITKDNNGTSGKAGTMTKTQ